jgi:NAD-dependent dihydropyrimidine dehydrogenase PreA subunit
MSKELQKLWYRAARTIAKASKMPIPLSSTVFELLKLIMTEEQARFILHFKSPTLTLEQLKEKTDYDIPKIQKFLNDLMEQGVIVGVPSRTIGIMVYRLLPMWPGLFEYQFLRGDDTELNRKKAQLFEEIFEELKEGTQKNYETIIHQFKTLPPLDRVIPVEEQVEIGTENVMPYEEIKIILNNYEDIAVSNCYCRTEKELVNDPCKLHAPKRNCFFFDKSAQFVIEHNFGERIGKDDAIKLFQKAEDYGLVHKVFHVHLNPNNNIEAICNCCKCCCGPFQMYHKGIMPIHTITSYIAKMSNKEDCIGCGICVEKCPVEAIHLIDDIVSIDETKCIGCGVCAHHCPEEVINLQRVGQREVFIPPKKLTKS